MRLLERWPADNVQGRRDLLQQLRNIVMRALDSKAPRPAVDAWKGSLDALTDEAFLLGTPPAELCRPIAGAVISDIMSHEHPE